MPRLWMGTVVGVLGSLAPCVAHTWVQGPAAPVDGLFGRGRSAMVYDAARNRTVLFGGQGYVLANDTWEFDGTAWTKGAVAPAGLTGRASHGMSYDIQRSRSVVFGGFDAAGELDETWEYDGTAWTPGPAAPAGLTPRRIYAMAYDSLRGRSVIFGGSDGSDYLDETWELDGTTWTQASPASSPEPRVRHALAYDLGRGATVLFGGAGMGALGDTWAWDGTSWTQLPGSGPSDRGGAVMAYDPMRAELVLFGGGLIIPDDETWRLGAQGWQPGPAAPQGMNARIDHVMAWEGNGGRIALVGGVGSATGNDLWLWDGTSWQAGPTPPPALTPRHMHAAAFDSTRGRLVLFGGASSGYVAADTWEYDGSTWIAGPPAPPGLEPREGAAMAFDTARRKATLYGGTYADLNDASTYFDDTWEYDAAGWTPAPTGPPGRHWHAMAHDETRRRTVLFGGLLQSTGGPCNETWEYDGATWVAGPAAPPLLLPRDHAAMVYFPAASRIFLFGGATNRPEGGYSDSWLYDGASWTPGPPTPPEISRRWGHGLAPIASGERLLMYGAPYGGWPLWETDGATWWKSPLPPAAMGNRQFHSMAHDSVRDRVVVFGGLTTNQNVELNDTWEHVPGLPGYVVGAGLGAPNPNRVRALESSGAPTPVDFLAYAAGAWGTNVAAGPIATGGDDEIVTGPGPGPIFGPHVRGFRADGTPIAKIGFYAYGTLKYGANVAAGDFDGPTVDEILTGAGPGAIFGPHVRAFTFAGSVISPLPKVSFYAYGTLRYGVNVCGDELDGDAFDEILTGVGPGPSLSAHVRGFQVDGAAVAAMPSITFFAFAGADHGVNVAAGFTDFDAIPEVVAARGPGPAWTAEIAGFVHDGTGVTAAPGFSATPFTTLYGARVAVGQVGTFTREPVLAAAGRDAAADSTVKPHFYDGTLLEEDPFSFLAMPGTSYGVNTTTGALGL